MMKLDIYNLEKNMPTVKEGQDMLHKHILQSKSQKYTVMKIIHGYGSTGVGGGLKVGVQKSLAIKKKQGVIKGYVAGERWSPFDEAGREILNMCPELRRDRDLLNGNEGITIVLL